MTFFDKIIEELNYASKYFKKRTRNEYNGNRFEEWVVKNSNIHHQIKNKQKEKDNGKAKEGCNTQNEQQGNDNPYWTLLEWRGDKYIDGFSPESSKAPDLLLRCRNNSGNYHEMGDIIAVECKWRSNKDLSIKKRQVYNYIKYIKEKQYQIKELYYVFGIGWSDNKPDEVYIIPATKFQEAGGVYSCDKIDNYKWNYKPLMYFTPKSNCK